MREIRPTDEVEDGGGCTNGVAAASYEGGGQDGGRGAAVTSEDDAGGEAGGEAEEEVGGEAGREVGGEAGAESLGKRCRVNRNEPNTWDWPSNEINGIVQVGGVGQSSFLWFVRTRPNVIAAFARIWGVAGEFAAHLRNSVPARAPMCKLTVLARVM